MTYNRGATRRTAIGATAAALVSAITMAGCSSQTPSGSGSSSPSATQPKKITFWTIQLKQNFNDYITGVIKAYEAKNPGVTVEWVDVPGLEIDKKFASAVASGQVPDAVNITSTTVGQFTPALAPLDQYLPKDKLTDYTPGLIEPLRRDGNLMALPWYNGGAYVSMYRKSVVSKVGFDPKNPPKDVYALLDLADKIHDAGLGAGTTMLPSYLPDMALPYAGVNMVSPDKKKATFNTPEAVRFLKRVKESYDKGSLAKGSLVVGAASPQNLENGQIAFRALEQAFYLQGYQKNQPSLYKDLIVLPSPQTPKGESLLIGQQVMAVPKAAKNPQGGADFAAFLTNGENQLAFCKLVSIYPSTISSTKDPLFTNISGEGPEADSRRAMVDALPRLTYAELGTVADKELSDIYNREVIAFMEGKQSAEDALAKAASAWDERLAKG